MFEQTVHHGAPDRPGVRPVETWAARGLELGERIAARRRAEAEAAATARATPALEPAEAAPLREVALKPGLVEVERPAA